MNNRTDHWSGKLNFISTAGSRRQASSSLAFSRSAAASAASRSPAVVAPKYSASTFFSRSRSCSSISITSLLDRNEAIARTGRQSRKIRRPHIIVRPAAGLEESWIIERVKYVTEIALRGIPIKGSKGELTYGQPNLNAAVRALRLCCNIKGMLVHRHEVGDPGEFSRMTDEELDRSLERHARAVGLSDSTINEILGLRCVKTKHQSLLKH